MKRLQKIIDHGKESKNLELLQNGLHIMPDQITK